MRAEEQNIKNVYRKIFISLPCMVVLLQKANHSVLLECSPEATRKEKVHRKVKYKLIY